MASYLRELGIDRGLVVQTRHPDGTLSFRLDTPPSETDTLTLARRLQLQTERVALPVPGRGDSCAPSRGRNRFARAHAARQANAFFGCRLRLRRLARTCGLAPEHRLLDRATGLDLARRTAGSLEPALLDPGACQRQPDRLEEALRGRLRAPEPIRHRLLYRRQAQLRARDPGFLPTASQVSRESRAGQRSPAARRQSARRDRTGCHLGLRARLRSGQEGKKAASCSGSNAGWRPATSCRATGPICSTPIRSAAARPDTKAPTPSISDGGRFADFYDDHQHGYSYREARRVYQWRHGVFSRSRDGALAIPWTQPTTAARCNARERVACCSTSA